MNKAPMHTVWKISKPLGMGRSAKIATDADWRIAKYFYNLDDAKAYAASLDRPTKITTD